MCGNSESPRLFALKDGMLLKALPRLAINEHIDLVRITLSKKFKSSICQITDHVRNSKLALILLGLIDMLDSELSVSLVCRFQKAIKKVRATQRMRRQRGFAFSQTESKTQDQEKLIRAYDTSVQRPSGY